MDLKTLFEKLKETDPREAEMRIRELRSQLIRQTILEARAELEKLPKGLSISHNDFVRIVEDSMFRAEKACGIEYGEELFQELGGKLVLQFEMTAAGQKVPFEVV